LLCALLERLTSCPLSTLMPACWLTCPTFVASTGTEAPERTVEPVPTRTFTPLVLWELSTWSSTHHSPWPGRSSAIRCSEASTPPDSFVYTTLPPAPVTLTSTGRFSCGCAELAVSFAATAIRPPLLRSVALDTRTLR